MKIINSKTQTEIYKALVAILNASMTNDEQQKHVILEETTYISRACGKDVSDAFYEYLLKQTVHNFVENESKTSESDSQKKEFKPGFQSTEEKEKKTNE